MTIPFARARSYWWSFGLMDSKHWTYLEVEYKGDNKVEVTNYDYDSKGRLSMLYGMSHVFKEVKEAVKARNPNAEVKCKSRYLGTQGLMDNHNCGRFVISYIFSSLGGKKPEDLKKSEVMEQFGDIDGVANVDSETKTAVDKSAKSGSISKLLQTVNGTTKTKEPEAQEMSTVTSSSSSHHRSRSGSFADKLNKTAEVEEHKKER